MTRSEMIDDIMEWRPDTNKSALNRRSLTQIKAKWASLNETADREADEVLATSF